MAGFRLWNDKREGTKMELPMLSDRMFVNSTLKGEHHVSGGSFSSGWRFES
jgi:hypothetical protein